MMFLRYIVQGWRRYPKCARMACFFGYPRKSTPSKSGFTLIELSISAVIAALIGLIIAFVYRGNLISWKWGLKHMEFNQKIQLAMKQIFTDVKRVNPLVSTDENGNLWFQGEKIGDLVPNLVEILDTDKEPANGGEEVSFYHTTFNDLDRKLYVRIFLEDGALVRETTDPNGAKKRIVISNKVTNLHFESNSENIFEIAVSMTITDDRNPELKENLSFAVHLDTDLVCVKMKLQS